MMEQVCAHIHNYFTRKSGKALARATGTFTIEDGTIEFDFLKPGNMFLIRGSDFNDGIHEYPATDLNDETFDGAIYKMAPDAAFIALCDDISQWQDKYGKTVNSPFQSESFAGYSYTKANGTSNRSGTAETITWQTTFKPRLDQWRKLNEYL